MVVVDVKQKMGQILEVLDQLAEDTSVPRNIRRGATEAKSKLEKNVPWMSGWPER